VQWDVKEIFGDAAEATAAQVNVSTAKSFGGVNDSCRDGRYFRKGVT